VLGQDGEGALRHGPVTDEQNFIFEFQHGKIVLGRYFVRIFFALQEFIKKRGAQDAAPDLWRRHPCLSYPAASLPPGPQNRIHGLTSLPHQTQPPGWKQGPAMRIGVNLSFTRAAAYFSLLNARQNQGIFVFHRPFPLLAFLEVDRLG
jgi:hypothetical protein